MDRKLKHLEFIQGVINRLSTNSFLLKGWTVVLVSALFVLSGKDSKPAFIMLAYIPAVVFWGLDGYFIGLERAYRRRYDEVRGVRPEDIDFAMTVAPGRLRDWLKATFSKTLIPFYGSILAAVWLVDQLTR